MVTICLLSFLESSSLYAPIDHLRTSTVHIYSHVSAWLLFRQTLFTYGTLLTEKNPSNNAKFSSGCVEPMIGIPTEYSKP
jgi:hypothetical protein